MGTFLVVWLGQVVSLVGSGLTGFALGVWVYRETGSVTAFAAISLVTVLPGIVLSPLAGTLVDRWDRRRVMLGADTVAGLTTVALAFLAWTDRLALWNIILLLGVASTATAFQNPAFTASTTLLVPKRLLSRASGLTQIGLAAANILAPLLAGALLAAVGLAGVLVIDGVTFVAALLTLVAVRFPRPEPLKGEEVEAGQGGDGASPGLLAQTAAGWRYLTGHAGFVALLALVGAGSFALGTVQVLITPLILTFADARTLGWVLSVAGSGLLVGGIALSTLPPPRRRRLPLMLTATACQGLVLFLAALEPSAPLVAAAAFAFLAGVPLISGHGQVIWQVKVPPGLQGRVFALRRIVSWSSLALAYALAGPLADGVFEPLMAEGGGLAPALGPILGTGAGRGIALMFLAMGAFLLAVALLGSRHRPLMGLEEEIPDAVEDEATTAPSTTAPLDVSRVPPVE